MTWSKWVLHAGAWMPLAVLILNYLQGNLTANPVQAATQRSGLFALIFLLLSLACTPIANLGIRSARAFRRPLGLYAFFYAAVHIFTFFILDYGGNIYFIWIDLNNKRYILVGMAAFLILSALASTSFRGSMKRLGKRWHQLHRLVYIAGGLVIIHYAWSVKADIRLPAIMGCVYLFLMLLRIPPIKKNLVVIAKSTWQKISQFLTSLLTAPEIK